jgi:hypothetical protein
MLEYGASRLIPLESAQSAKGDPDPSKLVKFKSNPPKAATALVRQFILSDEDIKQDPLKFVLGWGWDHTKWPEQGFPTAVRHSPSSALRSHDVLPSRQSWTLTP